MMMMNDDDDDDDDDETFNRVASPRVSYGYGTSC